MRNIICFLTVRPSKLFYDFCKKLKDNTTDVYICIDDNDYHIEGYDNEINIIKVDNTICENDGFKSTVFWLNNKACSKDKALYYFCKNNIDYENIWFIEEDVFIPSINTIKNIDKKYGTCDLIVSKNYITYEKKTDWHWNQVFSQTTIPPPYAISMVCAIRCSKRLLDAIHYYASIFNNLFIDEVLFNTIALRSNLNIITPDELSTIEYRKDWDKDDIKECNLYHPMKDICQQYEYRDYIREKKEK